MVSGHERSRRQRQIDFEFSLALNNRTGKYFLCLEILKGNEELIHRVRYWRWPTSKMPGALGRRILGRLFHIEIDLRLLLNRSALFRMRPDRPILFTDPLEVLLYRLRRSDVVICHDLGPLIVPELYSPTVGELYGRAYAEVARVSPSMVFVTQSSREEYERLFGMAYCAAKVIHPPLRRDSNSGLKEDVQGVRAPYLLTVGAVGSRKNQLRAIDAFERAGLADLGLRYVICGGPEPGYESVRLRADKSPHVSLLGYVSDAQLRWLYANATGFVLPSLLEGFGLPAAEAIAHGLVPLVSRGGALNEVTGPAAILVDPHSVESIASGMRELATMDCAERAARLQALTEHASQFSTDAATESWREVIERALEERSREVENAGAELPRLHPGTATTEMPPPPG